MKNLIAAVLLLTCGSVQAYQLIRNPTNGLTQSILYLDIGGSYYDVTFDYSFGEANVFAGDFDLGKLAIDQIAAAINDTFDEIGDVEILYVDNPVDPFRVHVMYSETEAWEGALCLGFCVNNELVVLQPGIAAQFRSTVVPIPAAVWLFGSALAGLGWMRRRRT